MMPEKPDNFYASESLATAIAEGAYLEASLLLAL